MKTLLHLIALIALATSSAFADAKVKAGARKSLILDLGFKQTEFFVEKTLTPSAPAHLGEAKQGQR